MITKVPAKTPEEKKLLLKTVGIPSMLLLVVFPTVFVLQQEAGWLTYFLILCAFFAGFDVWVTVILDLLIFCKLTPRFVIIEGTAREDYADIKPHLVGGGKGLVISTLFSVVWAAILIVIQRSIL